MFEIPRKYAFRTEPRHNRRAFRNLLLWMSLLVFFGFAGRSTAEAGDVQSGHVASVGPGPQFAIADFDGDLRPDLVSIQAGLNSSSATNYWLQLQLSAVGRQSIRLVAP